MSTREVEKLLEIGRREPSVLPGLAAGYLPTFDDVVAVTSSAAAVMTTVGVYESARLSRDADLRTRGLRVAFNRDATTEARIAYADHTARLPPAIRFFAGASLVHTTYLTSETDMWALEGLALSSLPAAVPERGMAEPEAGPSFTVRQPAVPRAVDRQAIPHLLVHLAALRLPLTAVLGNAGCLHCDDGAMEDVSQAGDLTVLRIGRSTLSFDSLLIGSWHVRPADGDRDRLVLEARCPRGRRQFYMTAAHRDCGHAGATWNVVLDSLPRTGAQ